MLTAQYPPIPLLQAVQQHLQRLRQFKRQRRAASTAGGGGGDGSAVAQLPELSPAPQRAKRHLFPMQINLAADDVALRFEHHPLEVGASNYGGLLLAWQGQGGWIWVDRMGLDPSRRCKSCAT